MEKDKTKQFSVAAKHGRGGTREAENTPLSWPETLRVFDRLASMDELCFEHAQNGCRERAHVMAHRLREWGYTPTKAWAFEGDNKLSVIMPDGKKHQWWFHTAPVLTTALPDGGIGDVVLDPALFDGPVPLKEWGDLMRAAMGNTHIKPLGVPPIDGDGNVQEILVAEDFSGIEGSTAQLELYKGMWKAQPGAQRTVYYSSLRQQADSDEPAATAEKKWVAVPQRERMRHEKEIFRAHQGFLRTLFGIKT